MNHALEILFQAYLDGEITVPGPVMDDLRTASATVDAALTAGTLSGALLGDYELAASRAGFAAGYTAAIHSAAARPDQRRAREAVTAQLRWI